jgi:hypothetical protein
MPHRGRSNVRTRLGLRIAGILLGATVALCPASHPLAAEERPDYGAFHGSFFVPFAPGSSFEKVLRVRVRINGGPVTEVLVDTGSTGMLLGQGLLGSYDPGGRPDEFTYSSDGQVNHGVWNDVTVEFVDGRGLGSMKGASPVARLQALVVTSVSCRPSPYPGACRPGPAGKLPAMMGVGFGPIDRNAILNLTAQREGALSRGFVIEPKGLRIGLTRADVTPGFSLVRLARVDPPEPKRLWKFPAASITATTPDGTAFRGEGGILMDSGIGGVFLGLPDAPRSGLVPPGTAVRIRPAWIGAGPELEFTVGDERPGSPAAKGARWVHMAIDPSTGSPSPFVNTGLRPLGGYRYLYDAEGGYWGLERRR